MWSYSSKLRGGLRPQWRSRASIDRSSGSVTASVGTGRRAEAEHEAGGVEQLGGQPPADLHLVRRRGRCRRRGGRWPPSTAPRPRRTGPAARPGVTSALPLDLESFLRSGSRIQPEMTAVCQGSTPCSARDRTTEANSQVRMISCDCGRRSIGKTRANRSGSRLPAADDLRRERRGGPGVHHVGVADEPARLAALGLVVPVGRVRGRVDRQAVLGRGERLVVVGLAVLVEAVPDREGHAEEALPADQPVAGEAADPVLVPVAHAGRHPVQPRPSSSSSSRRPASRPPLRRYHCRELTISSGRSPRS